MIWLRDILSRERLDRTVRIAVFEYEISHVLELDFGIQELFGTIIHHSGKAEPH